MRDEARFNEYLAGEFLREYEKETGKRLRFERVPGEFPDAIFKTADASQEVGAEFVRVTLGFILQELDDLDRYRQRFCEILQPYRPRFKNVEIMLQPSFRLAAGLRPVKLPPKRTQRRQLVKEFERLWCAT